MRASVVSFVLAGLLFGGSAFAAAPVFSCTVNPTPAPQPNTFQASTAAVAVRSGTVSSTENVEIRLGSSTRGTLLATVCGSTFTGRGVTPNHTIELLSTPAAGSTCNAVQTTARCAAATPPPG